MQHYVAYHKDEDWLDPYNNKRKIYGHYSKKPLSTLNRMIGNRVWVISGSRDRLKRMRYFLQSTWVVDKVQPGDGEEEHRVIGRGRGFDPPVDLMPYAWFKLLVKEQHHFSLGMREITQPKVIAGLNALADPERCELLPEEIEDAHFFSEGLLRRVTVNAFERNLRARRECIKHHGVKCVVCGFDFEAAYGSVGAGFIHVHHLKDLASIRASYTVDPKKDLRPVCPNCHAMLHSQTPSMTVAQLKRAMRDQRAAILKG